MSDNETRSPDVTLLETAPQQSMATTVFGHRVISVARADSTATGPTHRFEAFGAIEHDEDERHWPASPWFEPPWER